MGTSTSFADALAQQEIHKGPECSVGVLLRSLDADTADEVRVALDDTTVQHAQIARALGAIGHKVGATTISRHRAGDCKNCSA